MMNSSNISIIIWLLSGCILIFIMVIIGGVTRLTGSGLSMVDWNLFMGSIPPLTYEEWQETFNLYKQYPEYQVLNYNFSLADFKNIFFWEYLHRLIGRLLGLVFIIPFSFFLITKKLNTKLIIQTSILLILGSLQGVIGWWMVKSGLVDKPDVSHYRLTIHLLMAFLTFAYAFWIALSLIFPNKRRGNQSFYRALKILLLFIIAQIIYGGFVAGLNAGQIYNTWPKMHDKWIAESVYAISPIWKNFTEGLAGVQFVHRILGFIILVITSYIFLKWRKSHLSSIENKGLVILFYVVISQIIIGVLTLLLAVPIWLGVLHQIGAFVLIASSVFAIFTFKPLE